MWEPRRLTTLWAFMACYKGSFTFFFFSSLPPPATSYARRDMRTQSNLGQAKTIAECTDAGFSPTDSIDVKQRSNRWSAEYKLEMIDKSEAERRKEERGGGYEGVWKETVGNGRNGRRKRIWKRWNTRRVRSGKKWRWKRGKERNETRKLRRK
jgi:hypothetical protein